MHYDMRGRQPGEDDDFVLDRLFGSFKGKIRETGYDFALETNESKPN